MEKNKNENSKLYYNHYHYVNNYVYFNHKFDKTDYMNKVIPNE